MDVVRFPYGKDYLAYPTVVAIPDGVSVMVVEERNQD